MGAIMTNETELDEELQQDEAERDESTKTPTEDDDHAAADEAAASSAETEEEREEIRARRRDERKRKKEAQREREDSLRRELSASNAQIAELHGRLAVIERKSTGNEVAQIDAAIRQANDAANYFQNVITEASTRNDIAAVADAVEKKGLAKQRAVELDRVKAAYVQQRTTQSGTVVPPPDQEVVNLAKQWMSKNPWYNQAGHDLDSQIMLSIDQKLYKDGWRPNTPEYWKELTEMGKKYLPQRFISRDNRANATNRTVVAGSGRDSTGGSASNSTHLSAERVNAMKEAGLWDDPKLREKMITRYRQEDKEAANNR